MWPFRKTEDRQASAAGGGTYTDAIVQAILSTTDGNRAAVPAVTAALETAAALYASAFASARVMGTTIITPALLANIGRSLIRHGEALYVMVGAGRALELIRAHSWDITGGYMPSTWRYHASLPAPSASERVMRVPAGQVIHVRYSEDAARPWVGVPPLGWATGTGALLAIVERVLQDESGGTRGYVLPLPAGGNDAEVAALKGDLGNLQGRTALVETTASGWGAGRADAPTSDWRPRRIGPDYPTSVVELRRDVGRTVVAACGVPLALVEGADAQGLRESWRLFLHGGVAPLARLVEGELSAKLGRDVQLDFTALYAADVQGRARAFQSLTGGGMDVARAAALAGLS